MTVYPIQATFSRGKLTRALHGRVDIDHYRQGVADLSNWIVLRHGGVTRRPGTIYVGAAKHGNKATRLIEFVFSTTQAYILEFGDFYIRFWTAGGQVVSAGAPYEIVTPYGEADLENIKYKQSADAIYIACAGFQPHKLKRSAETSWTIEEVEFEDGPYLKEDPKGTYMVPTSRATVHPSMTSNTTPSGTAADSSGHADAWRVFDGDITSESTTITAKSGWYSYTFPGSTAKVADAYWIIASDVYPSACPTTWTFDGYDGTSWTVLDTRRGETGWGRSEQRYFEFVNETAYRAYRLKWSNNDGNSYSYIAELGIHERAENQTAFSITASSTAGINGGAGFKTTDVGRSIRLFGTDGKWRWGKIEDRSSSTVVTVKLYGHALTDTANIARWQMSCFSVDDGFPAAVGFFKERLGWAATSTSPQTVWLSKSADYENHGTSSPSVADDAMTITMTGGHFNSISWLEESFDFIAATAGSMRTIGQATTNQPFSATNVDQLLQSHVGASSVDPVVIQRMAIFADASRTRLHEFGPDPNSTSGGYAAPELTILSSDLFEAGITKLALQNTPFNLIWAVLDDGSAVTTTYERAQQIVGCGPHEISGGTIESGAVIPGSNGDQMWFVVRRIIDGAQVQYIERMADPYDGATVPMNQSVYGDCSLIYTGSPASSFSGFDHLEGETIGILADGVDIGDAVVSSGEITLPNGKSASTVVAGLRIDHRLETLPLPSAGNRDGSAIGRAKNVAEVIIDVMDAAGLMVGTRSRVDALRGAPVGLDDNPSGILKSGPYRVPASDSWRSGGVVVVEGNSMYPATIRSLTVGVEGEP